MRAIDSRFYWVGSDEIDQKYFYENKSPGKNAVPARSRRASGGQRHPAFHGRRQGDVVVRPGNDRLRQADTIRPAARGAERKCRADTAEASLSTMMEDLYERATCAPVCGFHLQP